MDWHGELRNAEAQLLDEFRRWLLSPELVSISREIAKAISEHHWVEVFLTCTPIELARLPWETWEIGTDLGKAKIRIARTPANICHQVVRPLHRKVRILAISGDDTGVNLDTDKEAVRRSLKRIAEIKFISWKGDNVERVAPDANALRTEIVQTIADESGWDVLFFAGHSYETVLTGGELGIAPNVSLSIMDIEEALQQAKQRRLQFAIFNSCSGINIAESLINLGLSQVVVMREPIHNQVAQEFLGQFLQSLAEYKDVHEAMLDACQFLKQKRLSYPSAYFVPSLFRHPEADLFRIKPFGLWSTLKQWLPTPKEAKWLGALLLLSLLPLVQNLLLEPRILLQAVYRRATLQVPAQVESPLLFVQIDNKSLIADKVQQRYPLDYSYLAKLIQKLSDSKANLIGIDYVLDEVKQQPENVHKLSQVIHNAIVNKRTWFVFGYQPYEDPKQGRVSDEIAKLNWSMEGDITFFQWYVELLPVDRDCADTCPFSYLLASAYSLQNQQPPADLPSPNLHQKEFRSSVINPKNVQDNRTKFLHRLRLFPISNFFEWFHPIIDFSIPPERAYKSISACELLSSCASKRSVPFNLDRQVIVVAPGGYEQAGLQGKGDDNYTIPLAVAS